MDDRYGERVHLAGEGLRLRSAELATVTLLRLDDRLRLLGSFLPSASLPCTSSESSTERGGGGAYSMTASLKHCILVMNKLACSEHLHALCMPALPQVDQKLRMPHQACVLRS